MMTKRTLVFICIISFLCFVFIGCNLEEKEEITIKKVGTALFKDVKSVFVADYSRSYNLEPNEIKRLQKAILNGTELISLDGDSPSPDDKGNLAIVIDAKECGVDLVYEDQDKYIFVSKIDIHWREKKDHIYDLKWQKAHLAGIYRFRVGKDMELLMEEFLNKME